MNTPFVIQMLPFFVIPFTALMFIAYAMYKFYKNNKAEMSKKH